MFGLQSFIHRPQMYVIIETSPTPQVVSVHSELRSAQYHRVIGQSVQGPVPYYYPRPVAKPHTFPTLSPPWEQKFFRKIS